MNLTTIACCIPPNRVTTDAACITSKASTHASTTPGSKHDRKHACLLSRFRGYRKGILEGRSSHIVKTMGRAAKVGKPGTSILFFSNIGETPRGSPSARQADWPYYKIDLLRYRAIISTCAEFRTAFCVPTYLLNPLGCNTLTYIRAGFGGRLPSVAMMLRTLHSTHSSLSNR